MKGRPRKNWVPIEKHEDVIAYYVTLGKSIDAIAKAFDVNPYGIKQILVANSIPIRKQGVPKGTRLKVNIKREQKKLEAQALTAPLGEDNVA